MTSQAPPTLELHHDLETKILRSSAWSVLGFGGSQALSLVTMLVLARLLLPEEFGVVALALALLAVAQVAQESGLGAALIVYRGDLRCAAACVSVFAPLAGLGLYAAFFAAAPLAADFFRQPDLTAILRVLALILVFRGIAITPIALLQRSLSFRPITAVELAGGLAQAATAIVLAVVGAGVWSLVFGHLALGLTTAVLAWVLAPIRPSPLEAQRATLRDLTRYGRHVALANVVNYATANSQGIVVGRVLGTTALGYYAIAGRVAYMSTTVIGNILGRGVFAALAIVHGDPARFRRIWLENLQRLALLSVPAALMIALVAEPLVLALLGNEWRPAIPILQLLALSGVVGTFSATSGEVFQALHRPKLRVLTETAYILVLVPALLLGARAQGLEGAAGATLVVSTTFGLFVLVATMRLLGVRAKELGNAISRPAIGWAFLVVSILVLRPLVDDLSPGAELLVLIAAGGSAFALSVAVFAREIATDMWVSLRGAGASG